MEDFYSFYFISVESFHDRSVL